MRTVTTLLLFLALFACNKEKKKPYSYWTVNGEEFSSNETELTVGKARTDFGVNDLQNDVGFTFMLDHLPLEGTYPITNSGSNNPAWVGMGVHYHGNFYNIKHDLGSYLTATNNKGKSKLTMPDTWFKGYFNPDDSVLVSCEFNEP